MPCTANEIRYMTTNETRNCIVSFAERLDDGEILTGTPTVSTTAGATISNIKINDAIGDYKFPLNIHKVLAVPP